MGTAFFKVDFEIVIMCDDLLVKMLSKLIIHSDKMICH